jgi:hypothetical protein
MNVHRESEILAICTENACCKFSISLRPNNKQGILSIVADLGFIFIIVYIHLCTTDVGALRRLSEGSHLKLVLENILL